MLGISGIPGPSQGETVARTVSVGPSPESNIIQSFRRFDRNQHGWISRDELERLLRAMIPSSDAAQDLIDCLLVNVDKRGDGRIDYEDFVDWIMQEGDTSAGDSMPIEYRSLLPERFELDIDRRYVLDKLVLGEGGYGKVFVARDRTFQGRLVAVKRVTKSGKPQDDDQYKNEIRIMKDLDHPSIVKLFETFETGRHLYFVMEYCEGGELFDRIIDQGNISEDVCANIISQVSSALCYAHNRSIAHRDLKPENVCFCSAERSNNTVKLIDWGLGITFAGTRMTSAVGSFAYSAPEVITSRGIKEYTSACDLWGLGVLTYVMLSGKPPFFGTERQQLKAMMAEVYPLNTAPWPSLSQDARDFVKALIKVRPSERMPIQKAVVHPWLLAQEHPQDTDLTAEVLGNLRHFTNQTVFGAVCVTSVARQLGHRKLHQIHKVFRELDKNGDGVLSLAEVKEGFAIIHGEDSEELSEVEGAFKSLDLDESMHIDYTEFCAAGLGQVATIQDDAVWAAFKAFDIDDSGTISSSELRQILQSVDVKKAWSIEVCADVAHHIVETFDRDGDGAISFDEWRELMETCWANAHTHDDGEDAGTASMATASLKCRRGGGVEPVYDMLCRAFQRVDAGLEVEAEAEASPPAPGERADAPPPQTA